MRDGVGVGTVRPDDDGSGDEGYEQTSGGTASAEVTQSLGSTQVAQASGAVVPEAVGGDAPDAESAAGAGTAGAGADVGVEHAEDGAAMGDGRDR